MAVCAVYVLYLHPRICADRVQPSQRCLSWKVVNLLPVKKKTKSIVEYIWTERKTEFMNKLMMFDYLKAFMKKKFIIILHFFAELPHKLSVFVSMVAVDQKNHDDQDYNQSSSWSANKDQQLCVDGWVIQEFRFLWKKRQVQRWKPQRAADKLHKPSKENQEAYSILRLKCHAPTWYCHHIFCFSNS